MMTGTYKLLAFLAFLSFGLSGCSKPVLHPPATPASIYVSLPPSLQPLSDALHACSEEIPEIALFVEETHLNRLENDRNDLALHLGYPESSFGYAAQIGVETILVILNDQNPVTTLSPQQVVDIFRGRISRWREVDGDSLPIQVWDYPSGDEFQQAFSQSLLAGGPATSLALIAPDPTAMLEAISGDPAAIGYLPGAWLSDQVKAVEIEPQTGDRFNQPILAIAPEEPHGFARVFLACLQSGAGQDFIRGHYRHK